MGSRLSSPQTAAVEILMAMEERLKADDFAERFKLAVISADPQRWTRVMFPDWFAKGRSAQPVAVGDDEDLTDTTGTWIFPEDDLSPDQVMQELQQADQLSGGIADLGEWGEWQET